MAGASRGGDVVTTAPEQPIDLIAVYRLLDDTGPRPELAHHEKQYAAHVLADEGLTLRQIAARLGVAQRTINRWRNQPVAMPDTEPASTRGQAYARCREVDPAIFYPLDEEGVPRNYSRARSVCASCTVRTECREGAMAREGDSHTDARDGMWGGLSPDQRHALAMVRKAGV